MVANSQTMLATLALVVILAALGVGAARAAEWQLTTGTNWNDDPEWCEDNIIFYSDRELSSDYDIWKMEVNDMGQVGDMFACKVDALHDDRAPTWEYGRCGSYVYFERQIEGGTTEIRGMTTSPTDPGPPINFSGHADRAPDRSGGDMLIYSDRNGNNDIWAIDHGGETYGSDDLTENPADDRDPCWSPDENWIAFASDRSGNWDIWVMSAGGEGDSLRQLTTTPENERMPSWSPNGEYIAFVREGEGIVAVDPLGRVEHQVTTGATDSSPTWSEYADMLAFSREGGGGCHIWVTDNVPESPVRPTSWGRLKAMYR